MKRNAKFLILTSFLFLLTPLSNSNAAEDSVYDFSWLDKDKEVYVLQNRKFRKKSKLTLGASIGNSISGAFVDSQEINLLGNYFFKETWGLEFAFNKSNGKTNATFDAVRDGGGGAVAFYKRIESSMSFMLLWAPFYSKINTFNKIFYYDWIFGLGLSNISTEDNRNEFQVGVDQDVLTEENETAITWMTGLRFYLSQSWSARMDFRATHNNTEVFTGVDESTKRFLNYYNFNLGLNYTF